MNKLRGILMSGALAFWPAALAAADVAAPKPVLFLPEVLEPEGRFTLTPGFTPDGETMFFAQTECLPIWECPQRLKRIDRAPAGWTKPHLVPLPQAGRVDYPSVTPDGRYLLFSWAAVRPDYPEIGIDVNFDLWRLDLTDPAAVPELLEGPDLNRIRAGRVKTLRFVNNETAPILTETGDLYFWTERLDGVGERDVYLARGDAKGGFQKPDPAGKRPQMAPGCPLTEVAITYATWRAAETLIANTGGLWRTRNGCTVNGMTTARRSGKRRSTPFDGGRRASGCGSDLTKRENNRVSSPTGRRVPMIGRMERHRDGGWGRNWTRPE
ncbi:MAG: hypothetical protein U5J99_09390 [Parvularculaceae bacterium]|nr:hypothetical protein [Parvularculaceae bacterium]